MSIVLRGSFPDLNDLRIASSEYIVDAMDKYPAVYPFYCHVGEVGDKKEVKGSQLSGIPPLQETGENEDFPLAAPVEGYDWTASTVTYKAKIQVSIESQQDDPKGIWSNLQTQIAMGVQAGMSRVDIVAANKLIDGWSVTGPDGQFLFDTDHPQSPINTTQYQNTITTKLDAAGIALQDMWTQVSKTKDMAGHRIIFPKANLVVPPALKTNALKSVTAQFGTPLYVHTSGTAYSGSSAPSPAQTGQLYSAPGISVSAPTVVEQPYVATGNTSDAGNAGSNVKWYYVGDPAVIGNKAAIHVYWKYRPQLFNAQINPNNGAFEALFLMRCAVVVTDWHYIFASDGTV